jgi:hypothetical protein
MIIEKNSENSELGFFVKKWGEQLKLLKVRHVLLALSSPHVFTFPKFDA